MNPWQFLLPLLAAAWSIPMIGIRRAGAPAWFFIGLGLFWLTVCAAAGPLYDWGILLRRQLGMNRLADFAERVKPRLLPPARMALLIMALISLAAALP